MSTAVVVVEDDCVRARDDFPLRNPASNELLVIGKQVAPLGGFEEMHYHRQNLVLRLLREEHLVGEDGVTQSHVRDCELLETTRHQCRVQPREGVHGILPVAAQGCTPGRADSMRCQQRGPHEYVVANRSRLRFGEPEGYCEADVVWLWERIRLQSTGTGVIT